MVLSEVLDMRTETMHSLTEMHDFSLRQTFLPTNVDGSYLQVYTNTSAQLRMVRSKFLYRMVRGFLLVRWRWSFSGLRQWLLCAGPINIFSFPVSHSNLDSDENLGCPCPRFLYMWIKVLATQLTHSQKEVTVKSSSYLVNFSFISDFPLSHKT